MNRYPEHLKQLIEALRQFPGVGTRTAERYAFQMLDWQPRKLQQLGKLIESLSSAIHRCEGCGCIMHDVGCPFCTAERTANGTICVVASPRDVYAIESTGEYRGAYHVIDNLLSPMDGIGPAQLKVDRLKDRIQNLSIEELIIAFDSTLEGDATALYIKEEVEPLNVAVSRLAFGLPVGSSLDYVDGGTLARAFLGRSAL